MAMSLRRKNNGVIHIIAPIGVVVALFLAMVFVIVYVLPDDEQKALCGGSIDISAIKWLEAIFDDWDPKKTTLMPTYAPPSLWETSPEGSYDLPGNGYTMGRARIFELGTRTVIGIAIFTGCTLADQNAEAYEEEVNQNLVELTILVALEVIAPGSSTLYTSFQFVLEFMLDWDGYDTGDVSLGGGPDVSGIDETHFPDNWEGKEKDRFIPLD